jgi:xanthosine phosphorylase
MPSLDEAMTVIRRFAPNAFPKIGIILGSGLSLIADQIENPTTIPFQAFGLSAGTVAGHASQLVFGMLNGYPVVCLKGRLHLYEGTTYESLRIYMRIFKHLGVRSLIITAASGSLTTDIPAGTILLVNDHINFQPGNPLVGPNDESFGPRFLNQDEVYDRGLMTIFKSVCDKQNVAVRQGVYVSVLGPMFETPAEVRAFRIWGGDVVGMSLVPEVMVARHAGIRVLGVTVVTNLGAGLSTERLSHDGTLQQGELGARKLNKLIPAFLKEGEAELNA